MCKVGIYKIENKINKKVYIGQSINIEMRWKNHIRNYNLNKNNVRKFKVIGIYTEKIILNLKYWN